MVTDRGGRTLGSTRARGEVLTAGTFPPSRTVFFLLCCEAFSSGPECERSTVTVRPVKWTVHGERVLYMSEWVGLSLVDVEIPGGRRFEHHVVRHPHDAAGTVIHDPDRGVLLLWRHRFITDSWGYEIPAGRIDPGEQPLEAAAREAYEETGWQPGPLEPLVRFNPS